MPVIACPHCGRQLDSPGLLAGANARCTACGGRFTIPGMIHSPQNAVLPPEPPPVAQQPQMVVVHTQPAYHPPQPRLESPGWFTRSFMTTLGVVAGLLFIPLACLVGLIVLIIVLNAAVAEPRPRPAQSVSGSP
jgi:hypothetical protein